MSTRHRLGRLDSHERSRSGWASVGSWSLPAQRSPAVVTPTESPLGVAALFELHYVHLVRLARHLLDDPSDAEDVVMDAFAGLERRWRHVRRSEDAFFYLRASVVNGTHSRLRRLQVARDRRAHPARTRRRTGRTGAHVHLEHESVVAPCGAPAQAAGGAGAALLRRRERGRDRRGARHLRRARSRPTPRVVCTRSRPLEGSDMTIDEVEARAGEASPCTRPTSPGRPGQPAEPSGCTSGGPHPASTGSGLAAAAAVLCLVPRAADRESRAAPRPCALPGTRVTLSPSGLPVGLLEAP